MTKRHTLVQDKVVEKKDPKACERCSTPTRHKCAVCAAVQCAMCLNMANRCPSCAGASGG